MKHLGAREKFKLAQLDAAQLKEVIEEEEAQNKLKQKIWQEENELKEKKWQEEDELKQSIRQKENELKQRIRQKEARRKIQLANAQYETWKDSDVKAERDLQVKSRVPLGGSQSKKEPSL